MNISFEASKPPSFDIIDDIEKHEFALALKVSNRVTIQRYLELNRIRV